VQGVGEIEDLIARKPSRRSPYLRRKGLHLVGRQFGIVEIHRDHGLGASQTHASLQPGTLELVPA
jgi:hypothetical protein